MTIFMSLSFEVDSAKVSRGADTVYPCQLLKQGGRQWEGLGAMLAVWVSRGADNVGEDLYATGANAVGTQPAAGASTVAQIDTTSI